MRDVIVSWRVDFATPENGRMCISNGNFIFQRFFFQGICQFSGEYIFYRLFGVLIPWKKVEDFKIIHAYILDSSAIIFRRTLQTQGFVKWQTFFLSQTSCLHQTPGLFWWRRWSWKACSFYHCSQWRRGFSRWRCWIHTSDESESTTVILMSAAYL